VANNIPLSTKTSAHNVLKSLQYEALSL